MMLFMYNVPTQINIVIITKNPKNDSKLHRCSFLLQRFDILRCLSLRFFNSLLVALLLLKLKPLLEEEAGLLRFNLLTLLDNQSGVLLCIPDSKNALKQAADLLGVAILDFQVQKDVPEINTLGEGREKAFEYGATTFDVTVRRAEFELCEFGCRFNVGVGGEGLEGTRE